MLAILARANSELENEVIHNVSTPRVLSTKTDRRIWESGV